MDSLSLAGASAIGFAAGMLGGLLGIGGSVLMIPAFVLLLPSLCGLEGEAYHIAQAVAMAVNIVVAIPAAIKHHRGGRISWRQVRWMLPAAIVCVVAGVALSNRTNATLLRQCFGGLLLLLAFVSILDLRKEHDEWPQNGKRVWPAAPVGGLVGGLAGIFGIGGGVVTVPLLSKSCHLPIKRCVGASSMVICITAPIGAWRKLAGLPEQTLMVHGDALVGNAAIWLALKLSLCVAPAAFIGSWIGASLTSRAPATLIRVCFVLLLAIAGFKMLF